MGIAWRVEETGAIRRLLVAARLWPRTASAERVALIAPPIAATDQPALLWFLGPCPSTS